MAYYDQFPLFHAEANVTQAFFTDVLYPQGFAGFWTITTVTLLHSLLVLIVTAAFLLRSKTSFVGSYWHAATQLFSENTRSIFEQDNLRTDKEVRRQFSSSIGHGQLVRYAAEASVFFRIKDKERDPESVDRKDGG